MIACPGSGKTSVALAKIIEEGERLSLVGGEVLAITFAVSAKEEIERRVEASAGSSARRCITVNTIHGFVLSQLIAPFGAMFAGHPLRLAQEGGLAFRNALREASQQFGVTSTGILGLLKYTRRVQDGTAWRNSQQLSNDDQNVVCGFWDILQKNGYVDYPSALYVGARLLQDHVWIREGIAAKYPSVVVDEYQDCTDIQLQLLQLLKQGGSQIFLVGDLHQCVFEFLGANVSSLQEFVTGIGAEQKPLGGSYRCPQNVLDVAERLFPRGLVPLGKALAVKGETRILAGGDTIDTLVDFVGKCDADAIARSEIAFVAAFNNRLETIVDALNGRGIPTTYGRIRRHDEDWFALLVDSMLLTSPPSTENDFANLIRSLTDLISRFVPKASVTRGARDELENAAAAIVFAATSFTDQTLNRIFSTIIERTMSILDSSNVIRPSDLRIVEDELQSAAECYSEAPEAHVSVSTRIEELRPDGKVRGYTYLGIKGLEFDAVAIVDIGANFIPHRTSTNHWADLRQLYVAITRSKRHLLMLGTSYSPSRFMPIITGTKSATDVIGSADPIPALPTIAT